MRVLIDTHIFLWWDQQLRRLSRPLRAAIEDETNDIVVRSTTGYEAFLSEAVLDMRAGKIVSDKPVLVKTSTFNINANGMEVSDRGDLLRFERGVTVLLLPDPPTRYEARSQ